MTSKEMVYKLLEGLNKYTDRDIDILKTYLEESDFFTAPASTRYHGCYPGGLCDHTVNVILEMQELNDFYKLEVDDDDIVIAGLCHDLCKIDVYEEAIVNIPPQRSKSGKWEQQPGYKKNDKLPMGHGAKSLARALSCLRLSEEIQQAIYWHMGAFDLGNYNTVHELSTTFTDNKLAFLLHMADMVCTYIVENE